MTKVQALDMQNTNFVNDIVLGQNAVDKTFDQSELIASEPMSCGGRNKNLASVEPEYHLDM